MRISIPVNDRTQEPPGAVIRLRRTASPLFMTVVPAKSLTPGGASSSTQAIPPGQKLLLPTRSPPARLSAYMPFTYRWPSRLLNCAAPILKTFPHSRFPRAEDLNPGIPHTHSNCPRPPLHPCLPGDFCPKNLLKNSLLRKAASRVENSWPTNGPESIGSGLAMVC
jgi:hypothetical protein